MEEENETSMNIGADEKVGNYLRRIRETRGVDIEQLAESIRLGKNILLDIEENRWEKFPTEAYLRSYIISLCEKLHVDKTAVINKFSEEIDSHFRVNQSNLIGDTEHEPEREKSSAPKIIIIAVILIVGVLFFVSKIKNSEELEPDSQAPDNVEKEVIIVEEIVEANDSLAKSDSLTKSKTDSLATATAASNTESETDSLRFECTASATDNMCGVSLKDFDSKMNYFKRYETRTINRKDTAQVTITVPERTKLLLNGKKLEYGRFNTLLFFDGKIVNKTNRNLR